MTGYLASPVSRFRCGHTQHGSGSIQTSWRSYTTCSAINAQNTVNPRPDWSGADSTRPAITKRSGHRGTHYEADFATSYFGPREWIIVRIKDVAGRIGAQTLRRIAGSMANRSSFGFVSTAGTKQSGGGGVRKLMRNETALSVGLGTM